MIKPWSIQKELKGRQIPNQNELLSTIYSIPTIRDQALIVLAYLTAGRISEVVKEKNLKKVIYKSEEVNGKKRLLRTEDGKYILDHIDKIPLNYPGIQRKNISYSYLDDKKVMVISMQNRKNKTRIRKDIPILIERETEFVQILQKYMETIDMEAALFPFSKCNAYKIIRKHLDMNCHFLRDIRLTHLVTVYGRDGLRLQKFAGWSDLRPAEHYVHLDWRDIWK